jgi:hypothetical protein
LRLLMPVLDYFRLLQSKSNGAASLMMLTDHNTPYGARTQIAGPVCSLARNIDTSGRLPTGWVGKRRAVCDFSARLHAGQREGKTCTSCARAAL